MKFDLKNKQLAWLIVNGLTLVRVLLTIIFVSYLWHVKRGIWSYALLFLAIVLTDFWDGRLARKWGVCSKLGAGFDVLADFFFIISAIFILHLQKSTSFWLPMLILAKMLEFILTSRILEKKAENQLFVFDPFGKGIAISFYIMPIVLIIARTIFKPAVFLSLHHGLLIVISSLSILSAGLRIKACLSKKPILGFKNR